MVYPSLPPVLLLQTECDFSSLPLLLSLSRNDRTGLHDVEQNATPASNDNEEIIWWKHRFHESPLTCDILMLPMTEDEDARPNGNLEINHGVVVFPRQELFPCSHGNLLNIYGVNASHRYQLALSDCTLDLSPTLHLPLSLTTQPDSLLDHVEFSQQQEQQQQQRSYGGSSLEIAFTTQFLALVLPLEERTRAALVAARQINSHHFAKPFPTVQLQPDQIGITQPKKPTTSVSVQESCSCAGIGDIKPNFSEPTGARIDSVYFSKQQELEAYQEQLRLLNNRLEKELQSIQTITSIMVILPGLAVVVMGVWIVLDKQRRCGKKQRSSLSSASTSRAHHSPECLVGDASACSPDAVSPLTEPSSTSFASLSLTPIKHREELHKQKTKTPAVGDLSPHVIEKQQGNAAELDVPSSFHGQGVPPNDALLPSPPMISPLSQMTLKWEKKQQEKILKKQQRDQGQPEPPVNTTSSTAASTKSSISPSSGQQSSKAKLAVSPESPSFVLSASMLRTSRAVTNLAQLANKSAAINKPRPKLTPDFGLACPRPPPTIGRSFEENFW